MPRSLQPLPDDAGAAEQQHERIGARRTTAAPAAGRRARAAPPCRRSAAARAQKANGTREHGRDQRRRRRRCRGCWELPLSRSRCRASWRSCASVKLLAARHRGCWRRSTSTAGSRKNRPRNASATTATASGNRMRGAARLVMRRKTRSRSRAPGRRRRRWRRRPPCGRAAVERHAGLSSMPSASVEPRSASARRETRSRQVGRRSSRQPVGRGVARGEQAQRLGPQRQDDGVALGRGELRYARRRWRRAARPCACPCCPATMPSRRLVVPMNSRRKASRAGGRCSLRRADLLEAPAAHHGDAVGDRQRLLLVVRHVDRGDAERLLQLADLAAHLDPQLARRGWRAARRAAAPAARSPARGRSRRAAAGRRRAGAASARRSRRAGRASARARPAASISLARHLARLAGRRRRCRRPSGWGRWRSSGTPCRCCACAAAACRCAGRRSGSAPLSSSQKPATMRSSVVLPQPEGPSSVKNSPSRDGDRDVVDGAHGAEGPADAIDRDAGQGQRPPNWPAQRVAWMMSLIFSSVSARFSVQPSSS